MSGPGKKSRGEKGEKKKNLVGREKNAPLRPEGKPRSCGPAGKGRRTTSAAEKATGRKKKEPTAEKEGKGLLNQLSGNKMLQPPRPRGKEKKEGTPDEVPKREGRGTSRREKGQRTEKKKRPTVARRKKKKDLTETGKSMWEGRNLSGKGSVTTKQ